MNYLEKYLCSSCSVGGMKLWRPIHGLSGWLCARCATDIERPRLQAETNRHLLAIWPFDADGLFTFSFGDQLGDMLPAVPTADGSEVYGYGNVPEDRSRWWHEMPTHVDAALEVRCLRNLSLRSMAQFNGMAEMYLQSICKLNAARKGQELRDRVAALVTIFLRDAIVKAGGAATVAAFDDVAVRHHFLSEVAALTETAMLALPDGALDSWSHADLVGAIGVVHIEAAACRVIARHEDRRASWLKTLGESLSAPD